MILNTPEGPVRIDPPTLQELDGWEGTRAAVIGVRAPYGTILTYWNAEGHLQYDVKGFQTEEDLRWELARRDRRDAYEWPWGRFYWTPDSPNLVVEVEQ